MNSKKFRTILCLIALVPALIVGGSGLLSAVLFLIFPSIMNLFTSVFWISLGLSYVLFALDTFKMNKKK